MKNFAITCCLLGFALLAMAKEDSGLALSPSDLENELQQTKEELALTEKELKDT